MASAVAPRPGGFQPDLPGLLPAALLGEASPDGRPPPRSTRDWVVDVVAFTLSVGLGLWLFFITPDVERRSDWFLLADLLSGAVFSVSLWWRRRWPVQLSLATVPFLVFSSATGCASLILFFTVAVHRRAPMVLLVGSVQMLASIGYGFVRPDVVLPPWVNAVVSLAITLAVAAWGMLVRARRQLVVSLRERAARAEAEQQLRVEQARQLERTRIAREMHDVLAHRISLVSLHAGALEFRADPSREEVAQAATVIRESAHRALQDLRDILGVLRPEPPGAEPADPPERPQPTPADLPRLVEESRTAGRRVTFANDLPLGELPEAAGRTVYRIVQEGLTNAGKHAPGSPVRVSISGDRARGVSVEVLNRWPLAQQPSGAAIPGSGQGLTGLGERLLIAGGRLEHGRDAGGDFRLAAWLPWPAQ